jgi:predicted Zn finger-like uncharacterized protein
MVDYKFLKIRGALSEAHEQPAAPIRQDHPAIVDIAPEVVALVPESVARAHNIIPLAFDGETITIAGVNADDIALADRLRFLLAKNVRLVTVPRANILQAIDRHYGRADGAWGDRVMNMTCHGCSTRFRVNSEMAGKQIRCPSCGKMLTVPRSPTACVSALSELTDASLAHAASRPRAEMGAHKKSKAIVNLKRDLGRDDEDYELDLGADPTEFIGGNGMLFYTVEEGQRVLMTRLNGTMEIIVGPHRVWRGWSTFRPMQHYVAHPDEFLVIRFRDGRQEHLAGPTEVWFDPRVHLQITKENALQISAKEAVVVYSRAEGSRVITRRIVNGPALFVPLPGEWLHTFSWHASRGGHKGVQKEPNALVFQKLWLMPDQMYHDVTDVRTGDDAVLTIRLMIFFELVDIDRMLEATHDPIGDFVNAATSDVVGFTGRHDFEAFKHNTGALNELATYQQLLSRAAQCGYRINKVVYRGYGAAEALQQMHDQAIEARTRLQLDRATEQQAQDLENYKLDCQLGRASKRRTEQIQEVEHDLALARTRQEAELRQREATLASQREAERLEADLQLAIRTSQDQEQRQHLEALRTLGVDLTAFLTQARADQVIEFRGESRPHVHLDRLARTPGDGNAKGRG